MLVLVIESPGALPNTISLTAGWSIEHEYRCAEHEYEYEWRAALLSVGPLNSPNSHVKRDGQEFPCYVQCQFGALVVDSLMNESLTLSLHPMSLT